MDNGIFTQFLLGSVYKFELEGVPMLNYYRLFSPSFGITHWAYMLVMYVILYTCIYLSKYMHLDICLNSRCHYINLWLLLNKYDIHFTCCEHTFKNKRLVYLGRQVVYSSVLLTVNRHARKFNWSKQFPYKQRIFREHLLMRKCNDMLRKMSAGPMGIP